MSTLTTRTFRRYINELAEQGFDAVMVAWPQNGAWQLSIVPEYNGERLNDEARLIHSAPNEPRRLRRDATVRSFAERYGFTGTRLRFEERAP